MAPSREIPRFRQWCHRYRDKYLSNCGKVLYEVICRVERAGFSRRLVLIEAVPEGNWIVHTWTLWEGFYSASNTDTCVWLFIVQYSLQLYNILLACQDAVIGLLLWTGRYICNQISRYEICKWPVMYLYTCIKSEFLTFNSSISKTTNILINYNISEFNLPLIKD